MIIRGYGNTRWSASASIDIDWDLLIFGLFCERTPNTITIRLSILPPFQLLITETLIGTQ